MVEEMAFPLMVIEVAREIADLEPHSSEAS